jgi:probable H4MPT-linked C1 transfer pathway protein
MTETSELTAADDVAVLGLDLGGAHLKAALVVAGRIVAVRQVPCRLWEGLDRLDEAFAMALAGWPTPGLVALTMTGELADLFADRASGVVALIGAVRARLPSAPLRVWAGRAGFLAPEAAAARPQEVASANWLATASLAAGELPAGLLVDIGSTTTDLVPFRDGRVTALGTSDAERLDAGELVYQGLTRTAVMAIARRAPVAGRWRPLMHELFATSADLGRLLGRLDEAHDQHAAADGGPKTPAGSARRLARMVGQDLGDADMGAWQALAAWLAEAQLRRIADGLHQVLSRMGLPAEAPLIGAGCGRFLVAELARRIDRPWRDLASLLPAEPQLAATAAVAAPAAAVALLASASRRVARA